jgi:hypothetical protein
VALQAPRRNDIGRGKKKPYKAGIRGKAAQSNDKPSDDSTPPQASLLDWSWSQTSKRMQRGY